ncbi:MAG: hypothetical protein NTZ16_13705 [Verrucomicrobia bacterium]|nr:hypothetical protein [Verrucomicrobiota bacterium]
MTSPEKFPRAPNPPPASAIAPKSRKPTASSIGGSPPGSCGIASAPSPVPAAGAPGQILAADKAGIVIACGQNALRVSVLQLEGGRRLTAPEFLAGHSLSPGQTLP